MKEIVLVGYSGHAYVVLDSLLDFNYTIAGYCDRSERKMNPYNLKYLGYESDQYFEDLLPNKQLKFFISVGSNNLREELFYKMKSFGLHSFTLINPHAIISNKAILKEGVFINSGAKINALANIEIGSIINTGAIIEHECSILDFAHVAPGAVLAGNVTVGNKALIGANSVIREGVSIGDSAVVGAGSVVLNDIAEGQTWAGNPAKRIK